MSRQYDVIHFEALGEEAGHLARETQAAKESGLLPGSFQSLIIPETIQEFQAVHPKEELPDIITIKTHSAIPPAYFSRARKSIITRSAGYDHLEMYESIANITSLREYCVDAVAQTALKLVYAAAGLLNHYTQNAAVFERNRAVSFLELSPSRTATVFGAGRIGKRICELLAANGLYVQAVDIREKALNIQYEGTVRFVTKRTAIETSDIIVNAMNLTRIKDSAFYNENYFSSEYLSQGKKGLIFVNVTRGEIAPESGLLALYERGLLGGIGLDVFSSEDELSHALRTGAPGTNPDVRAAVELIRMAGDRSGNIYVQPHQAFNSDVAAAAKAADTISHLAEWYRNKKMGFDEQLPYYGKTV